MSTSGSSSPLEAMEKGNSEAINADPIETSKTAEEYDTPTTDAANTGVKPQRAIQGPRWFLVCLAIFSCNLLYGLDTTIVADIQAAIVQTFDDVVELGWLGIGFPLGSIAVILPLGKAFAIFDVKWLYIGSLTMFAAGSALCGAAPNMKALIVGRVWAGAGGAGMYLGNLNLLTLTTTPQERSIYMAFVILVYGTGSILGPIIGGSLADSSATWRWEKAFYINLIIFAAITPIYLFLLPSFQPQPNVAFLSKLKHLDWLGALLNAAIYVTFVMIFTFGGSIWPWDDSRIIALFVVFGLVLLAFVVTQYFAFPSMKERRLFPGQFLRSRTLILLYISTSCLGASLYVAIYYIPLYFQFVHGDTGTQAAVRLLPFIIFYIVGVLLNGILMPKYGYYMPWFLVSGVFMTIGGALMYTTKTTTPIANIYGYTILMGIGMTSYQSAYSVAPIKVSTNEAPVVIQFINVAQSGGILMALTISTVVFQNIAYEHLLGILGHAGYSPIDIRAAIAGARSAVLESAPPALRTDALEAIVHAIDDTYILVIAAGALQIICASLMKREKFDTKNLNPGG